MSNPLVIPSVFGAYYDSNGVLLDNTGQPLIGRLQSALRRKAAVSCLYGAPGKLSIAGTLGCTRRAPGRYSHVQVCLRTDANTTANVKASFSPLAQLGNGYRCQTSGFVDVAPTPFTWGTTNINDFRNPGGGATDAAVTNTSGTGNTLIEGFVWSDWIAVESLDNTIAGADPLFHFRAYSAGASVPGGYNIPDASSGSANPIQQVYPEFRGMYWHGSDQTAALNPAAPTAFDTGWFANPIVRFLLKDKLATNFLVAGDSTLKGYAAATLAQGAPEGNLNGALQQLAAKLVSEGQAATVTLLAQETNISFLFHNRMLNYIATGGFTHAFFFPWSINEGGGGDAALQLAIGRCNQLIQACQMAGVIPIVCEPRGGTANLQAYMKNLEAGGIPTLRFPRILSGGDGLYTLLPQYRLDPASGDITHQNKLGHTALYQALYARRAELRF